MSSLVRLNIFISIAKGVRATQQMRISKYRRVFIARKERNNNCIDTNKNCIKWTPRIKILNYKTFTSIYYTLHHRVNKHLLRLKTNNPAAPSIIKTTSVVPASAPFQNNNDRRDQLNER